MSKKEMEKLKDELSQKSYIETVPNEVIFLNDDILIRNFEVDFQEEEELVLAGGIKGIKALRL